MAITAARVTVSTSAVALNAAEADTVSGSTLTLKNTSANAADLGPAGVTAGAGFDLAAGATLTVVLPPGELLYAIRSAASDATIAVLRVGV
jgi:hypothetical protein